MITRLGMPDCILHNSVLLSKSLAVLIHLVKVCLYKDRHTTNKPLLVGFGKGKLLL